MMMHALVVGVFFLLVSESAGVLTHELRSTALESAAVEKAAGVPPGFAKILPPADAMAIKSWAFLKNSMESLGSETKSLIQVHEDMNLMRDDFITQQKLWDEAKQRVAQENTILQSKIKDAEMRVEDDFQYKAMREQKEAVLAAESAKLQSVVLRRKQQQEAWKNEKGILDARIQSLNQAQKQMYLAGTGAVQSFGLQEQKYLQDTSSKAAQLQTLEFQLKDLESGKNQQEMQSQVRLAELQTQLQALQNEKEQLEQQLAASPVEVSRNRLEEATENRKKALVQLNEVKKQREREEGQCKTEKALVDDRLKKAGADLAEAKKDAVRGCSAVKKRREELLHEMKDRHC